MATFNSGAALWDRLANGRAIARQALNPQPVFILGHPRTGTTHLHNLLSRDSDRFAYCDTLMAGARQRQAEGTGFRLRGISLGQALDPKHHQEVAVNPF